MLERANDALMERQRFAIDDVGDDDDEGDEKEEDAGEEDDSMMADLDAFLAANGADDEGLTGQDKETAEGKLHVTDDLFDGVLIGVLLYFILCVALLVAEPMKEDL